MNTKTPTQAGTPVRVAGFATPVRSLRKTEGASEQHFTSRTFFTFCDGLIVAGATISRFYKIGIFSLMNIYDKI